MELTSNLSKELFNKNHPITILFLIFAGGNASGGHYHSLDQITRALGRYYKIKIVTIGTSKSAILLDNPHFLKSIYYNSFKDIIKLRKELQTIIDSFSPSAVNCFDTEVFNLLLLSFIKLDFKLVLTKCGGPNPQNQHWQYVDNMVLFSAENYHWFKNNKFYNNCNINLIPNRINKISLDKQENSIEKKDNSIFNFLRISRLGGAYEKTLLDTFRLINILSKSYSVHLYVIGKIQNSERFKNLKKKAIELKIPVTFITDERAKKASDFLYLADCVIGTGRSFMEATSLGLPVLTPAKNANLPILVDASNFNSFFKTNFSERNTASQQDINSNLTKIKKLISDKDYLKYISNISVDFFNENFSLEKAIEKYSILYKMDNKNGSNKLKLYYKNILYLIKTIFGH